MSESELETLQTLNTIVYSTETGKGRFVFNEPIPVDLIKSNNILRGVVERTIDMEDKLFIESAINKIFKEKQLIYRIKFIYSDGSIQYSGQRSLSDYLYFILKKSLVRASDMGLLQPSKSAACLLHRRRRGVRPPVQHHRCADRAAGLSHQRALLLTLRPA